VSPVGSILFDSQALWLLLHDDPGMMAATARAAQRRIPVHASILTVVEASRGRADQRRLHWVLSRFRRIDEVTRADGFAALDLLRAAGGLSGHTFASDACVAALALRLPGPTVVYTSDGGDWWRLVGGRVGIVGV